jgi:hypothetical protein
MAYYSLSFADPSRPEGQRFLGVCIVEAITFADAIRRAWELSINPGGEVQGFAVPVEFEHNIPRIGINRLISKQELNQLGEFSERDLKMMPG